MTMIQQYSLSKNLQLLLQIHHINESELARQIDLPRQTINKIITGTVSDPKSTTLIKIANFFNISVDQLLGNSSSIFTHHKNFNSILSVPVLQDINLKSFETLSIMNKDTKNFIKIEIEQKNETIFAIILEDDSMFPKFEKGTILIFALNNIIHDNTYSFVYSKKNKIFLFRKIVHKENEIVLLPLNPNFPVITLEKNDKIIGKLIKSIIEYNS